MPITTIIHENIQNIQDILDGKNPSPPIPGDIVTRINVILKNNALGIDINPEDAGPLKKCGLLPFMKIDGCPDITENMVGGLKDGIDK